jgi:hypothetical protein
MPSAGDPIILAKMPGFRVATTTSTSDSSTFTTTETEVLSVTASLIDGVTYKVRGNLKLASSVANDTVTGRIREDSGSGTELQQDVGEIVNTTTGVTINMQAEYTASATGNKTFVVTGVRSTGTGNIRREAATNRPAVLYVEVLD